MNIFIRRMERSDVPAVKKLIDKTLLHKQMQKVYEESEVAVWDDVYDLETLEQIADTCHAYLIFDKDADRLLASGYIAMSDTPRCAHIGMVFTDFEVHNLGLGRKIITTLEQDEIVKDVDKIELSSSMSAYRFYRKLGFNCKDNEYQIVLDLNVFSIPMEKFVNKEPEASS